MKTQLTKLKRITGLRSPAVPGIEFLNYLRCLSTLPDPPYLDALPNHHCTERHLEHDRVCQRDGIKTLTEPSLPIRNCRRVISVTLKLRHP